MVILLATVQEPFLIQALADAPQIVADGQRPSCFKQLVKTFSLQRHVFANKT